MTDPTFLDSLRQPVVYDDIALPNGKRLPKSGPADAAGAPVYPAGARAATVQGQAQLLEALDALGTDVSLQAIVQAVATLSAALAGNHGDLAAIHADTGTTLPAALAQIHADLVGVRADTGTTLHTDLVSILTRLGQVLAVQVQGGVTANAGTNLNTSALALESGGNLATIAGRLAALVNGRMPVDGSGVVQPISAAGLPLPAGAAADASLQSMLAQLTAIKSALLAQVDFETSILTDGTNFFVRRESFNEGTGVITVAFTDLSGAAASPVVANLVPAASSNTRTIETALFDVVTAGTGTSVGDVIARVIVYDTRLNTIVAAYWHNLTTGAALGTAPAANAIVEQVRQLAPGASTAAAQATGNASLVSILTALGPLATDAKSEAMRALLASILAAFAPLATDAKSEAIRALLAGTLKNSELPVQGVIDMPTAGQAYTAGRGVEVVATTAGTVTLTYLDGSTRTRSFGIGPTRLPDAVTAWALAGGSTFAGTVCNLK